MAGSTIGKYFQVTTWGESHGKSIGCVIDGCPSNIDLTEKDINDFLIKRRPNQSNITTNRCESDLCNILSGTFKDKTLGTPICVMVENKNQISKDYENLQNVYRPSHADFGYDKKYGFRDYRGGGRSSGRETIGRVIAGAVAKKILNKFNIKTISYVNSVGNISISNEEIHIDDIDENPLYMPNIVKAKEAEKYILELKKQGDSVGGCITAIISNIPSGIGEPVFRKLDALLSYSLFSIGGVKAVEIGSGVNSSKMLGSEYNDYFVFRDNKITTYTNHSGGILGGISNSNDIIIKVHFKPTPSISLPQKTINTNNDNIEIVINGRHDPVIFPRANVVVESMINIILCDLILENKIADINNL